MMKHTHTWKRKLRNTEINSRFQLIAFGQKKNQTTQQTNNKKPDSYEDLKSYVYF